MTFCLQQAVSNLYLILINKWCTMKKEILLWFMQINGYTFYIWSNDSKTITTNKIQGFEQTYFSFQTDDKIFLLEKKIQSYFFFCENKEKNL